MPSESLLHRLRCALFRPQSPSSRRGSGWPLGRALACTALLALASLGLLACLASRPVAPSALPAPAAEWPELEPEPIFEEHREPSLTPWHYAMLYPGAPASVAPSPSVSATPLPDATTGTDGGQPSQSSPDGLHSPMPGFYALSLLQRAPWLDVPSTLPVTPPFETPPTSPAPVATLEARGGASLTGGMFSLIEDHNIMLLGTDRREDDYAWRTDAIIVAALRPGAGYVALFSIPRDLWVDIPDYGSQRINVVDFLGEHRYGPGGGPALLAATLEANLGIAVHGYARIHLYGLEDIIDALGGVTVDVERDFPAIGVEAGLQTMDGETALWYARDRSRSDDLDRTRRQQQILLAIAQTALQPTSLPRLPAFVSAIHSAVETDLTPAQLLALFRLGQEVGVSGLRTRTLDRTMLQDWVTPDGAMVLLPNRPRIEEAWADLTGP